MSLWRETGGSQTNAKTVLISGAGISGPTLAFWLKAAGFQPTLVERAGGLRSGGYVIDFWGLGYDIAGRMGLMSDLDRVGYRIRELRVVDSKDERITGFEARAFHELTGGRLVTLARSDLSRLLFAKIEATTEVIFDDEIVDLRQFSDHVWTRLRRTGERRFDLAIGADGLHSNLRRLVFGPQERFEKPLGYGVAAFAVRGYRPRDEDIYVIYNAPGRMLGRFALHADRTLFLFVFAAETNALVGRVEQSVQKSMLQERFGDGAWEYRRILDELDGTRDLYFDRVSQINLVAWPRGAGRGRSVLRVADGRTRCGPRDDRSLRARGRAREGGGAARRSLRQPRDAIARLHWLETEGAERFSAAFAPKSRWGLFLRNQVVSACAIPGMARLALGAKIADTLRLPDYDWHGLAQLGG